MAETTPLTKTEDETIPQGPNYPKVVGMIMTMLAIGTGIAYAIHGYGYSGHNDLLEAKIEILKSMDLLWLYLGLVVLGRTIIFLNINPVAYKKHMKGNLRSNQFFYQTKDDKQTIVVFQEDGPIGKYNRSNRSLQHMVEFSGGFFAGIGPVGWLFPKQTLGLIVFFSAGRILHQKGYSRGYGGHMIGFAMSILSVLTLEGLALIAFLKGVEVM